MWSEGTSYDNLGYQSQQLEPSVSSSPPLNPHSPNPLYPTNYPVIQETSTWLVSSNYSNGLEQAVLKTEPECHNQLITNSFHQFPQRAPGIFPSSQLIPIEPSSVLLDNPWPLPEAESTFRVQIPQANDVRPREVPGNLKFSQKVPTNSAAPTNDWVKIGAMFKLVSYTHNYTLEQTALFLELVFGFRAT